MKKNRNIEESLRKAEGNIKHEGMYLIEEERELIREKARGNITQKQFIDEVIRLHSKKAERVIKIAEDENESERSITYPVKEEKIIVPEN